jgi:hypothetical protein
MTEIVVTDLGQTVVVEDSKAQTVVTGIMGPRGPRGSATFGEMEDVDLTQLGAGALLIYNTQTQKWTATTLLDQQTVESGQF